MEKFKLKGSSDSQNINNKLTVLNLLLNHSAERLNHLDSQRDKMLNYSLIIFAVMISFSSRTKSEDWIYLVATPLLL